MQCKQVRVGPVDGRSELIPAGPWFLGLWLTNNLCRWWAGTNWSCLCELSSCHPAYNFTLQARSHSQPSLLYI